MIGFSKINSIVRNEKVPLFNRMKFNLFHMYLLLWPYILFGFAAFSGSRGSLLRVLIVVIIYGTMYFFQYDLWKVLMRATQIDESSLPDHLESITKHAGIGSVPVFIFPAEGLKFANAFFVGNSGTRKGIFISQFAYENLSTEEFVAIYAHEVGHAQPHQVLRRSLALVVPFICLVLFSLLVRDPHIILQLAVLISAFIIMKLFIPSQHFEREADLFAVKATKDVDSVISGLEKIYNLGILPERFTPSEEKRLTHPSLVKRKVYIREAAGQEIPKFSEPVVLPGTDPVNYVTLSPDDFSISRTDGSTGVYKYHEVTSMFPRQVDEKSTELTIRFTSAKENLKIAMPYDEVVLLIDRIAHRFSAKKFIDPGRFKRTYYIWTIISTFFGLLFAFIIGPALLILGIVGLVKRRKAMLLSIGIANILYFLYPYINQHHFDEILQKEYSIVFGLIGVICLFDYLGIRQFVEKGSGKGSISFSFAVFFSCVALGALLAIGVGKLWGQDPFAILGTYSILFFNALVLGLGLVISYRLQETKRKVFLILNLFMLFVLVLFQIQ
jgi:Zn-dependent protease with chaperone function